MLTLLAAVAISGDLDARIADIVAKPHEEKWLSIPWRTNLSEARMQAQAQGKPLLMWIMNGHPMGCT